MFIPIYICQQGFCSFMDEELMVHQKYGVTHNNGSVEKHLGVLQDDHCRLSE